MEGGGEGKEVLEGGTGGREVEGGRWREGGGGREVEGGRWWREVEGMEVERERGSTYKHEQVKKLTSPIIKVFSGCIPMSFKASLKKLACGFPTISAVVLAAYSNAATKGPGPRAKPSSRL